MSASSFSSSPSPSSSPLRHSLESLAAEELEAVDSAAEHEDNAQMQQQFEQQSRDQPISPFRQSSRPYVSSSSSSDGRPIALSDAVAAASDVYTHLAHTHQQQLQQTAFNSHQFRPSEASVLASPQPNPELTKPPISHPLSRNAASASHDEQFFQSGVIHPNSHPEDKSEKRIPPSMTSFSNAQSSQTRLSLHTSSPADLMPTTTASAQVRILDSNVSRINWLENKRFVLRSLKHALSTKSSEVSERVSSLAGDRLACEKKLIQTLDSYIKRTGKTLNTMLSDITHIGSKIDLASDRVNAEIARFDLTANRPSEVDGSSSAYDPQQFDHISRQVEEEIQVILSSIHAHSNFSLDASVVPQFDPFQVERIKQLEKENAQLQAKINSWQIADSAQTVLTASGTVRTVLPHNESQTIILGLQSQLEDMTSRHLALSNDFDRLKNDHTNLTNVLKHERLSLINEKNSFSDKLHSVEESLRMEQNKSQTLSAQLEQKLHELSLASVELTNEKSAHTSTNAVFLKREQERLTEMEELRRSNQRSYESQAAELKSLHSRLQQQHSEALLDKNRLEKEAHAGAEHSLFNLQQQFESERSELEFRVRTAKSENEQLRQEHAANIKRIKEEHTNKIANVQEEYNHKSLEQSHALQQNQSEISKLRGELELARRSVVDAKQRLEEERITAVHSQRQLQEQVEVEVRRANDAKRMSETSEAESKSQVRAAADSREAAHAVKLELEELKLRCNDADQKLRAAAARDEAQKREKERDSRQKEQDEQQLRHLTQQLSDSSVKASSLQLELDLLQGKYQELIQLDASNQVSAQKKEYELTQKIQLMEKEAADLKHETEAALSKMEVNMSSMSMNYASAKARIQSLLDQAEAERNRFAALQADARENDRSEMAQMRASMDLQMEITIARFVATHRDRMQNMLQSLHEKMQPMTDAAGETDSAALGSLRKAVNGSNQSNAHMQYDFLNAASVKNASNHTPSLPATKLQFETLISQLEEGLTQFFQRVVSTRQRASERYQAMLVQLKRQAREQLQQAKAQADAALQESDRQHHAALSEMEITKNNKIEHLKAEFNALNAEFAELERASRAELSRTCSEYERVLEEERSAAEAHCSGLLMSAKEEHVHDARVWEEEKQNFIESRRRSEASHQEAKQELIENHEKLVRQLREDRERLQRQLDEIDASTQATIKTLAGTHQASLDEALSLAQRSHSLELQVQKDEHDARETKLKREAEDALTRSDREFREKIEDIKLACANEIKQLDSEHALALEQMAAHSIEVRDRDNDAHTSAIQTLQRHHEAELSNQAVQHEAEILELIRQQRVLQDQTMRTIASCLDDASVTYESHGRSSRDVDVDEVDEMIQRQTANQFRSNAEQDNDALFTNRSVNSEPRTQRSTMTHDSTSTSSSRLSNTTARLMANSSTRHDEQLSSLQHQLVSSLRHCKSRIHNLELQVSQCDREKDRLIVEMENRLQRDIVDLKASEAVAKAKLEETELNLSHAQQYTETVANRWKTLSEQHDQLTAKYAQLQSTHQRAIDEHQSAVDQLERKSAEIKQELQTEVVDAEYQLHKEKEQSVRSRKELMDSHAAERDRIESEHQKSLQQMEAKFAAMGAESSVKHELTLQQLRYTLTTEAAQQRKKLDESHALQLKQLTDKYEAMLKVNEAGINQLQATIRGLEDSDRSLHHIIDGHDAKLHDLHKAHLQDLQRRLESWRENRKSEIQEDEEYLAMKMEAIKQTYMKREESLCKSCRQKLGSTSFRAALNRLCEEASHPHQYRALNSSKQALNTSTQMGDSNVLNQSVASSKSDLPSALAAKYASLSSNVSQSLSQSTPHSATKRSQPSALIGHTIHSQSAVESKQEGVLTLRFHPSSSNMSSSESPLVTTSASFTPSAEAPSPLDQYLSKYTRK